MDPSIWIRPRPKTARRGIYEFLRYRNAKVLSGDVGKVFLPSVSFPRTRGRPPKYDFLLISLGKIPERRTMEVYKYLTWKLHREVLFFVMSWKKRGKVYYYVASWRDVKTGLALPNTREFFMDLRNEIKEISRGNFSHVMGNARTWEEYPKKGKAPAPEELQEVQEEGIFHNNGKSEMEKTEIPHELENSPGPSPGEKGISSEIQKQNEELEKITELVKKVKSMEEEEKKRKEERRRELQKRRKEIITELKKLDMLGPFYPGRLTKKRKLQKELDAIRRELLLLGK